ncbi:hypothetical protein EXIGLDRAFT_829476 [Exidia glandulosa HHB12029]|uniref:F-box domain-containing protein n=1 Tax=Exidia glandulosa HHB12029 TaxID=1314781 RepID=A0A165PK13_EXIGL|nr:hypothetical protein EXIGLDRAFT_829476 [Exidia glandulosa HHB12029]
MDSTSALPPELLYAIFDHIGLWDIIRASHVSQRWRVLACHHPTYWRRVVLREDKHFYFVPATIDRAIAQLTRSSASPIDVSVVRHFIEPAARAQAQFNDLHRVLVENFHRIGALVLHVLGTECDVGPTYSTILQQVSATGLSSQIHLRHLTLTNVQLPEATTLFEGVVSFRYMASDGLDVMAVNRLIAMFPVLEELDLTGVELDASTIPVGIESWISHIRYLRLYAPRSRDFLALPSIARIPHVCVANPTVSDATSIVSHICKVQVDVELGLTYIKESRFCQPLTLVTRPTGLTRALEFMDSVSLPDVQNLASLSASISNLSIPIDDWEEAIGALPHLVSLRSLTLRLVTHLPIIVDTELHAPHLHELVLIDAFNDKTEIHAHRLEQFLSTFNPSCDSRVHLSLDGVILDEWSDGLVKLLANGAELRDKCV